MTKQTCLLCDAADLWAAFLAACEQFDICFPSFYLFLAACPSLDAEHLYKTHIEEKHEFTFYGLPRMYVYVYMHIYIYV